MEKQKLLIATRNKGKFPEIMEKLKDLPLEFFSLNDFDKSDFKIEEVEETAMTFKGNAIIKAVAYGAKLNMLTLADDSGLEIDALSGRPGIFSARYVEGSDQDRYEKILEEMKDVPEEKRTARFKCVIAIYNPKNQDISTFEGKIEGVILQKPKGTSGFGYDPIFFVPEIGETLAEIEIGSKNEIDHRGRALEKFKEAFLKNDLDL
ncbi:MAG TPA: non-canonical purine NTP pyrophosphatase, RdgB/HAM1 family [Candidatus Moranbacteria bacterium]|nr:MAG: Non-canonical purine NTP pyrophosphatase [Candidatus Moranbacteria bacterium GW2011_GWF1_36_78]HAT74050.1 non-canonical purine NTP pyrophosphatase, RdgB/HAM1 family [Candidatus Moranbacteria bacterium]HBY11312.1 non-canonical purine NTP pyrophosphatase, RdgB/HAM1 family [Candidatus Moranbacteria bacterium]